MMAEQKDKEDKIPDEINEITSPALELPRISNSCYMRE